MLAWLSLSLMTAASAADLAARPYTKAPPLSPANNWSGFYIGAMGGYAFDSDNGGGFGGGTVGYNWQFPGSQFVFGIEVDAAGASIKDSQTGFYRHRAGHGRRQDRRAWKRYRPYRRRGGCGAVLAKGGYAWANNTLSGTALGVTISDSHVHSGYTIGGGIEYMFAPNWSAKAEYMFTHLESQNYKLGGLVFESGTAEFNSVKVGINYHFR